MALSRIARFFPEAITSPVETLVNEPGWLYAQKCEVWWRGQEHLPPSTVLITYRSPLVKVTGKMYRPVADLILSANKFEVVGSGEREDRSWWGEKGEFLFARMTHAEEFSSGPLDGLQIREKLMAATAEALGYVLAAA
ncbi:hypothetical protein TRIXIE_74 [Mycobacterium phage Trixie]|uniref:Uncharacterized protein n=1 Tax=Mycobacterium phage Trixie TaxID=1071503 RepID=G1JV32_9CAUD|nr:hypothetical protein TRIXIE_74 [Mycobacterium phage Trixie]AEL17886.1 hypothetical protein TRIXIE_74 [Mycobacterium phage Trixie]